MKLNRNPAVQCMCVVRSQKPHTQIMHRLHHRQINPVTPPTTTPASESEATTHSSKRHQSIHSSDRKKARISFKVFSWFAWRPAQAGWVYNVQMQTEARSRPC